MRAWVLVAVAGCGARTSAPAISNTAVPSAPPSACGFTDFAQLDKAAWAIARDDKTALPRHVGPCLLQRIERRNQVYALRDGAVEIAEVTMYGMMILVPGRFGKWTVGMSSNVVLAEYPPDQWRIGCGKIKRGTLCGFVPKYSETNAMWEFLVDGEPPAFSEDFDAWQKASYEFFRNKTVRGIQANPRLD